jgi:lipopolysaccharide export system permease protein
MSRIDWIVLRRIASRSAVIIVVFFGILALIESLDTWRFTSLTRIGGPLLALTAITSGAARSSLGILPVTLLIGTIVGVLDLQSRRELTVIKAAGVSIWRVMRAPLLAAVLLGLAVSLVLDTVSILVERTLPITLTRNVTGTVWLEQRGSDGPFMLVSERPRADAVTLDRVTLFFTDAADRARIEAASARLAPGAWVLSEAVRYRPDRPPEALAELRVATTTTAGDMRVRLTAARYLTFTELLGAVGDNVSDPALRAAAITSLMRLVSLPGLLAGSVLIGFAFTSGYRRTNKYGGAVLYGIVLGFVVYVVTELANRSGSAGVLDPAFAAAGPAFVAIVIGLTVLLYREDGRA